MVEIFLKEQIESWALSRFQQIVAENANETDFTVHINSVGGSVEDALALYDYMRESGKNWHTKIDANCHSAALLVLLGAPVENRSASMNSTALIHDIALYVDGNFTTESLNTLTDEMKTVRDKVIKVYAERTNLDEEEALKVMLEAKERDSAWLLDNGFIGKINLYISNMKIFNKLQNLFRNEAEPADAPEIELTFEVKDKDGNVLFKTENQDFKVGDKAEPDGVFEIEKEEGAIIVVNVTDGVIVSIEPKEEPAVPAEPEEPTAPVEPSPVEPAPVEPAPAENIEAIKAILAATIEENEKLKASLAQANKTIEELRAQIKGDYKPEERKTNCKTEGASRFEDIKSNKKYFRH